MAVSMLDNISYKGRKSDNVRSYFSTIEDMVNFSENYLPDVYITLCGEDNNQYKFIRSNDEDPVLKKWRLLEGGGSSDLSSYYTKTQTNNLLDEKVDKVNGKDLSTNDFTDAYKQQIDDNESAIETLNGDSTVVGSVDSKVATAYSNATSYTDTECAKKVDKVSGKGLSTNDFTDELKTKLDNLENYDDTALGNRVTANENAITILNGDSTVNGSVDKKVASCLSDSKDYTDVSIQNAIRQTAIVCDAKPTISGTTITYYQGGVEKTITSDNKTKFYYISSNVNYSTIWIEGTEFTDTLASVDFADYVSKTNDVTSTYTGSDADKTKIPNIASMDALKSLIDTDLADKVNVSDIESTVSSSSDNPVKSSTLYNKFAEKVDISQGSANEGKILQVNSSGNLALVNPQSTIDLSDTVSKTNDVVSAYSGQEVDKSKIGDLNALDDLKDLVDTDLATKVDISQGSANEGKILQVNASGDLELVDPSASMGSDASDISYTNSDFSTLNNVKKALDNLFNKVYYVSPSISSFTMSPSSTVYEIGSTVSELVFNWSYNKDISEQTLTDCSLADETVRTATYSTPFSTNKTFTLNATDGENSVSKSLSISFSHKIYYGSSSTIEDFTSAFILGLSNKKFASNYKSTFDITVGSGEYGYICYPSSWGTISSWWIGGFEVDTEDCGTIAFTNASGNTTTFRITRTTKSGLGSISIQVK